ncbi:MAG: LysM peptidoglycan-binding domain-containing protein [Candidatus Hydrogenedentes bacterium]|nr:LysM peptidoglycan-binding domain-containing protein [Candidatus Hydrogenedentota bacterium]
MHNMSRLSCAAGALGILLAAGCATTKPQQPVAHQFEPIPLTKVQTQEVPRKTDERSATELLRAADEAFRLGNKAQESGDHQEALRQYTRMLEMLIDADLDSEVFYNLRSEFERILSSSSETSELFQKGLPQGWDTNLNEDPTAGDLFAGIPINEYVIAEIEEIQNLYPRNFQNGLNRSFKYRPVLEKKFVEAGLPRDLVWLAMVESQFHPDVTSRAGAAGMWQFMRGTGTRYGLRVDNYVDERRDWEKATNAAIAYLKDLRDQFQGKWPVAIASYNMGEGGMARAIAMNGGDSDLWNLIETPPASNHMQRETKKFYPKLLASIIVGKSPERYGFTRTPQELEPTTRIPVKGSYSLAALERASNLPSGSLKSLNPELIRGATPPNEEFQLEVPAGSEELVMASLTKARQEPSRGIFARTDSGSSKRHTVRRGETLSGIASKYGVSVSDLAKANRMRATSHLTVGRRLVIPASGNDATPETVGALQEIEKPRSTAEGDGTHTVKSGDTLFDIARNYNISLEQLRAWNDLSEKSRISVNQKLRVRAPEDGSAPAAAQSKRVHKVARGEFPASIAQKYGVSVGDLQKWNKLTSRSVLRIGDELVIYSADSSEPEGDAPSAAYSKDVVNSESISFTPKEPEPEKQSYKVAKGDSLGGIASKYNVSLSDLRKWNNLSSKSTIHPGQTLVVYAKPSGNSASSKAAESPRAEKKTYKVAKGDTLGVIASKNHVSLDDLRKWNNIKKDSSLKAGETLVLYAPEKEAAPEPEPEVDAASEPAQEAAPEEASEAKPETEPQGEKQSYKVAKGDTPGTIAAKFGVKTSDLLKWNGLTTKSMIRVGDEVVVFGGTPKSEPDQDTATAQAETKSTEEPAKSEPVETKTDDADAVTGTTYKVAKGDTLGSIASKHKVSLDDLLKWNNLSKKSTLRVGDELVLKGGEASPEPAAPSPVEESKPETAKATEKPAEVEKPVEAKSEPSGAAQTYKVAKGDTLGGIASKNKVGLEDLLKWNNLTKKSTLQVGHELKLYGGAADPAPVPAAAPAPEAVTPKAEEETKVASVPKEKEQALPKAVEPEKETPQPSGEKRTHKVAKGESPSTIASKYGVKTSDLYKWNGLKSGAVLQVGQELAILGGKEGAPAADAAKAEKPAEDSSSSSTHTVAKGDNPTTIAKKYGLKVKDLYSLNGWPKDHMLKIGETVKVK